MNSNHNYRGTFRISGMLEGPLINNSSSFNTKVYNWIKLANDKGLDVDLDCGNGKFSLLFKDKLIKTDNFKSNGEDLEQALTCLLSELINAIPINLRCDFFSTIRSVEHKADVEIKTIYPINNNGEIEYGSREVEVTTIPSPFEKSSKKIRRTIMAFLIAIPLVVVLVIQFSGHRFFQIIEDRLERGGSALSIDLDFFKGYLKVEAKALTEKKIQIKLSKGEIWLEEELKTKDFKLDGLKLNEIIAITSLKKGYIGLDFYDKNGMFIFRKAVRIMDMIDNKKSELNLNLKSPKNNKVSKMLLVPI